MRVRFVALASAGVLALAPLAPAQTVTFVASLDPSQVTPAPAPTGATGTGTFTFNAMTMRLAYNINVTGTTTSVTDGQIGTGTWGVSGASTFPLIQTGTMTFAGTTRALTSGEVTTLVNEGFYCNVLTTLNPNGELRGQIARQSVLNARKGNVNTLGGAPPVDVLTVAGSIGHPIYRELVRVHGVSTVAIATPPARGNRVYAGWVLTGRSIASTLTPCMITNGAGGSESIGTATMCLPVNNTVTPGICGCPNFPGFTAKDLSIPAAASVCLHPAPADPRTPVSLNVNFPVGTWTVQAILFDPNAPTTGPRKVSLTNAVTVVAQ
ncbi:MAG: CHRD domain-containing protein [Planctomycetes bacterium]|nr:CHRD domain-containing protein [Planctomycetota bacterium]MBI3843161.1 CHRD domain-containing protein [Planctomycetota bacterium]